jgi:hypothetical protein
LRRAPLEEAAAAIFGWIIAKHHDHVIAFLRYD